MRDHSFDIRFFGDVTFNGLEAGWVGEDFVNSGMGFCEGGLGDVGHEDRGTFAGKEDSCFKADTAEFGIHQLVEGVER